MWFVFALITFAAWGTADLFYKKGVAEGERYSHLKTSVMVGFVMGLVAFGTILVKGIEYDPVNLLIYLPVSLMYILSMTVGYFGLRYLELSVSSPIQNASGAVSCLIMMAVLRELPRGLRASPFASLPSAWSCLACSRSRRRTNLSHKTTESTKSVLWRS